MENYLQNPWVIAALAVLSLWEIVWKAIGIWKAARNNQRRWFLWMFILNTAGILPIVYIKYFQKDKNR